MMAVTRRVTEENGALYTLPGATRPGGAGEVAEQRSPAFSDPRGSFRLTVSDGASPFGASGPRWQAN
jgi:hypothetical protein